MQRNTSIRLLGNSGKKFQRPHHGLKHNQYFVLSSSSISAQNIIPSAPVSTNNIINSSLPISVLVTRCQNLLLQNRNPSNNDDPTSSSNSTTMIQARECLKQVLAETKSPRLQQLVSALDEAIVNANSSSAKKRKSDQDDHEKNQINNNNNSPSQCFLSRSSSNQHYFQSVVPVASLSNGENNNCVSISERIAELEKYWAKGFFVQTFFDPHQQLQELEIWKRVLTIGDDKMIENNNKDKTVESLINLILMMQKKTSSSAFQDQREICLNASLILFLEDFLKQKQHISSATTVQIFEIASSILIKCLTLQDRCSATLLGLMKSSTSLLYSTIVISPRISSSSTFNDKLRDFAPFLSLLVAMFNTSIFPASVVSSCVLDVDDFLLKKKENNNNSLLLIQPWIIVHLIEEIASVMNPSDGDNNNTNENFVLSATLLLPQVTVHERLFLALLKQIEVQKCSLIISKLSAPVLSRIFDPIIKMKAVIFSTSTTLPSHNNHNGDENNNNNNSTEIINLLFNNPLVCSTVACLFPEWSLWIDLVAPTVFRNNVTGFRNLFSPTLLTTSEGRTIDCYFRPQLGGGHQHLDLTRLAPYQRRLAALVGSNTNNNNNTTVIEGQEQEKSASTLLLPSSSAWRQSLLLYSAVSGSTFSSKTQSIFSRGLISLPDLLLNASKSVSSSSAKNIVNKQSHPIAKQNAKFIRQVAATCTIENLHNQLVQAHNFYQNEKNSQSRHLLPSLPSHVASRLTRALLSAQDEQNNKNTNTIETSQNLTPEVALQLLRISCSNGEWNSALQLHEDLSQYFNDKKVAVRNKIEDTKSNSSRAMMMMTMRSPNNNNNNNNNDDNDATMIKRGINSLSRQSQHLYYLQQHHHQYSPTQPLDRKDVLMEEEFASINNNSSKLRSENNFSSSNSQDQSSSSLRLLLSAVEDHETQIFQNPTYRSLITSIIEYATKTTQLAARISSVARHSLAGNWAGVLSVFPLPEKKQQEEGSNVKANQLGEVFRERQHVATSVAYAALATGNLNRALQVLEMTIMDRDKKDQLDFSTLKTHQLVSASNISQWLQVAKKYSNAPNEDMNQLKYLLSGDGNEGETANKKDESKHEQDLLFDENNDIESLRSSKLPTSEKSSSNPISMKKLREKLDAVANLRKQQHQQESEKNRKLNRTSSEIIIPPTKMTTKLHSLRRTTSFIRASHSQEKEQETKNTSNSNELTLLHQQNQYFEALRHVHRPSGQSFSNFLFSNNRMHQLRIENSSSSPSTASAWQDAVELFQDAWMASERGEMRSDIYLGTLEHFQQQQQENEFENNNNAQNSSITKAASASASPPPDVTKNLVAFTKASSAFRLDPRVSSALIRTAAAAHLWSDVIDCFFILLDTSRLVPDKISISVVLTACKEIDVKCDKVLAEVKSYLESTLEDSFALLGDVLQHVKWFRGEATTIVTMEVRCGEYGKVNSSRINHHNNNNNNNNDSDHYYFRKTSLTSTEERYLMDSNNSNNSNNAK